MGKKELQLSIMKAQTAKLQLEIDIEQREADIARMKTHIEAQDKIIEEKTKELEALN